MGVEECKIKPEEAVTLAGLFRERVQRSPQAMAYRHYDVGGQRWLHTSWQDMAVEVGRWQAALLKEGLSPGERVGVMLKNSREWVVFEQAALGLGLVTVPLYTNDRAENVAYIAADADICLLLVEGKRQWQQLQNVSDGLPDVRRIVSVNTIELEDEPEDERLVSLNDWIFGLDGELLTREIDALSLATIVYTSGTTGRPKGVMLSHNNILANAYAASQCAPFSADDVFLSFLPLSHMLERTAGYYVPMMVGAHVVFARSVAQLAEDLQIIKPTILVSVPRIYERIHGKIVSDMEKRSAVARKLFSLAVDVGWRRFEYQQGRASWHPKLSLWPFLKIAVANKLTSRLGGRISYAICGGAALSPEVAHLFIGLGIPVYQGYGMTESSPVVCVNLPDDNVPVSIGKALPGVEVKIGDKDELLTRSSSVMMGYWNNETATRDAFDDEGWLKTGDRARIDEGGHVFIIGRLKEIIVLANGEKVPPADMEMAICNDPLFEQALILGEAKAYLSALLVLNQQQWKVFADNLGLDPLDPAALKDRLIEKTVLARVGKLLKHFPGYAQVRRITLLLKPWSVEDGLLTPTLKMKRLQITQQHEVDIDAMYQGRDQ